MKVLGSPVPWSIHWNYVDASVCPMFPSFFDVPLKRVCHGFFCICFFCPIDVTFLQLAVPWVDVTLPNWCDLNPLPLGTISYVSIALLGTVPPTDQWFHVFRLFAVPTMVILECPLGVALQMRCQNMGDGAFEMPNTTSVPRESSEKWKTKTAWCEVCEWMW